MSEHQRNKPEELNELSITKKTKISHNQAVGDDNFENDEHDEDYNIIENIVISGNEENNNNTSSSINEEEVFVDNNEEVFADNDDDVNDANDDDGNDDDDDWLNRYDDDDSSDGLSDDDNDVQEAIINYRSINDIMELINACPMDLQYINRLDSFYPLHTACDCSHDDAAIMLMDLFPEAAQHKDREGRFPLFLSMIRESSDDVIIKLIEIFPGAVFESHTEFGTALHVAYREPNQSETVIKKLLEVNPLAIQETDNDGMYPIHRAIKSHRSIDVIKILLDADPLAMQRRDLNNGTTPFYLACETDHVSLVEYFMQHFDLSVNIRDCEGKSPLHYAFEGSGVDVLELILHHPDVNVNATDMLNDTPLHKVMKFYYTDSYCDPELSVDIIQKLLDHPCILIDPKNNDNQTPLEIIKACLRDLEKLNDSPRRRQIDFDPDIQFCHILAKECCRKIIHLIEEYPIKQRWQAYCYYALTFKDL